jgi:hypothetical protein
MKLGDKIPVPELDELRVARMERAIAAEVATMDAKAQPDRSRSYRNAAIGMVAVAGVVLAIFMNLRAAQVPLLEQPWTSDQPTMIVTGPGQSSNVVLGDAQVAVGENTRVAVQRFSDGRTTLHLSAGSVDCEVKPRPERPTFQVFSGDVSVTVIGTAFEVSRSHIVEVKVERGIVAVATSHEKVDLRAGDAWQGSPFKDTSLALLLEKHASAQSGDSEPLVADATNLDNKGEGKHKGNGKAKGDKRKGKTEGKNGKPIKTDKTVKLSEVLLSAKPLPPIYKQSFSSELAKLKEVVVKNPKKAVRELESFAARATGDEASFALYSRAYVLFFKLGKHALVIKTAKQYARRFPRGAEAEDILWLRVRASCAVNDFSSCRTAAHTYLRRYPKGIFQGLASKIITTTKTE